MKNLLITGFDAFGGENINPSWESVKLINEKTANFNVTKLQIPTVFGKASEIVVKKAEEIKADVIICVGQAGGRKAVTAEVVAINLMEAKIPDNEGNQPVNQPIVDGGDNAYFSTLPVREIVAKLKNEGIDADLSFSAGAFVCNELLYTLLQKYDKTNVKVGFIHVPFLPEQAKNNQPSMPLDTIVKALETVINACV